MGIELPEAVAEQTAGMGEPIAVFPAGKVHPARYFAAGIFFPLLGVGMLAVL